MSFERIDVTEFKRWIDEGKPHRLVDVRTPMEREIAYIEPSLLLDESNRETLVDDDDGTPVVFYCHHGMRSAQAAAFFEQKGLKSAVNLEGGIDAWAAVIDPSLARY